MRNEKGKQPAGPAAKAQAAATEAGNEPSAKRARTEEAAADSTSSFLRAWAWKREHRPDRDRFQRPYLHTMTLLEPPAAPPAAPATATAAAPSSNQQSGSLKGKRQPQEKSQTQQQQQQPLQQECQAGPGQPPAAAPPPAARPPATLTLSIEQAGFKRAEGFASTVWDSSIVVSKLFERHPVLVRGRRVLDLSAGCGLVGLAAAALGAQRVVLSDLGANLPLLQRNCQRNGMAAPRVEVLEHAWGEDLGPLGGPFDVVAACDVMYLEEYVGPLVASLGALARQAEGGQGGGQGAGGQGQGAEEGRGEGKAQGAAKGQAGGGEGCTAGGGRRGGKERAAGDKGGSPRGKAGKGEATAGGGGSAAAAAAGGTSGPEAPGGHQGGSSGAAGQGAWGGGCTIYLAHGRNRFAEGAFWRAAAAAGLVVEEVGGAELHPEYQCSDVSVYRLRLGG